MERVDSFEELSKAAYEYLNSQQKICEEEYLLSKHEEWFYDQETGLLTFSNFGKVYVEINFESVGTFSKISNTWLWSWANNTIWPNVSTEILAVRDYGKKCDFVKLTEGKWDAEMYDGWEMTAISAYLLKAKGAYRPPNSEENIFSFDIFKAINVVDKMALDELRFKI